MFEISLGTTLFLVYGAGPALNLGRGILRRLVYAVLSCTNSVSARLGACLHMTNSNGFKTGGVSLRGLHRRTSRTSSADFYDGALAAHGHDGGGLVSAIRADLHGRGST